MFKNLIKKNLSSLEVFQKFNKIKIKQDILLQKNFQSGKKLEKKTTRFIQKNKTFPNLDKI